MQTLKDNILAYEGGIKGCEGSELLFEDQN